MKKVLVLFDFDGTITFKDSFLDFLIFSFSKLKLIFGFFYLSPILLAFYIGLIKNDFAKECVYRFFFKGFTYDQLFFLGEQYVTYRIFKIFKKSGLEKLNWHKTLGHKIVIVTASAEFWIKPWTDEIGIDLVSTRLTVQNNLITGSIFGKNCFGLEKVSRIKSLYNLNEYDEIYAYGDTKSDLFMLNLATKPFYKKFN